MRCAVIVLALVLLAASIAWSTEEDTDGAAPVRTWRKLSPPPRPPGEALITGMGVDSGGTLWVMTNTAPNVWSWPVRKLFWWDGTKWQQPKGAEPAPDADAPQIEYYTALFGGGKRGLYAVRWDTERGRKPGEPAKICRLLGGRVRVVAEVTHTPWLDSHNIRNAAFEPNGLYVARNGRLFVYGKGLLDMRLGEEWKLLARPKQPTGVSFVEQGDLVHIVYDNVLCTVSPDGTNVTRQLDGLTDDNLGAAEHAIVWGDDALLVLTPPRPEPVNLHAYDIKTGKPIDIDDVKTALKAKVVDDALRGPDGSAWILPADAIFVGVRVVSMDNAGSLRVLTRDGDLFELDELSTVNWSMKRSRSHPTSTLTASDGTFWLAPSNGGLLACRDNVFTRYRLSRLNEDENADAVENPDALDHEISRNVVAFLDPSPRTIPINFLAEAPDGTIYAASPETVYAFRRAEQD